MKTREKKSRDASDTRNVPPSRVITLRKQIYFGYRSITYVHFVKLEFVPLVVSRRLISTYASVRTWELLILDNVL